MNVIRKKFGSGRRHATLILTAGFLAMAGCGDIYDRPEFTSYVKDKTEDQIVKKLGKPAEVDSSDPEKVRWTYKATTFEVGKANQRDAKTIVILTRDPASGKLKGSDVLFQ